MGNSRLGYGEFEWPNRASARADGQVRFLEAIRRDAPEVLNDLAGEPFALFRALFCNSEPSTSVHDPHFLNRGVWWWPTFDVIAAVPIMAPALPRLRERLLSWARLWHLDADWVLSTALRTLAWWCVEPPANEADRDWHYSQHGIGEVIVPTKAQPFVFVHAGWEPAFQTRADARTEIEAAFRMHLRNYLDAIARLATERGAVRTMQQRQRDHFRWLVEFQIHGLRYGEIAAKNNVEQETARDAIYNVSDLIGLKRRPAPAGRPRKEPKPS